MFKQKNYLALGAVVFVAVLLLSLPTRATARLKLAVGSWFLPLFGLADAAQQLPADLADSALPRRELLREIDNLRRENQQLRDQQIQSAAIARENDQLRPAGLAAAGALATEAGQCRDARPGQLVASFAWWRLARLVLLLSFRKGNVLLVTRQDVGGGWWEGELEGRLGLFPPNLCRAARDDAGRRLRAATTSRRGAARRTV